jgi:serine/threonine-protein kinase
MAPEQLLNCAAVDHRADLYALGVLLYELLTGEVPRRDTDPGELTPIPPEPPSTLVPELSPDLDAVVLRAFADAPEARFQSADEFHTALAPFVGAAPELSPRRASPVPEPPPSPPTAVPTLVGARDEPTEAVELQVPRRPTPRWPLPVLGLLAVPVLALVLRQPLGSPQEPAPAVSLRAVARAPSPATPATPAQAALPDVFVPPQTLPTLAVPAELTASDAGVERRPQRPRRRDLMVRQF